MEDDIFWADKIAREVVEKEKKLQRTKDFRTEMGLGASGIPHVGSAGDGVRSFVVNLALRATGNDCEFIAFSDDRDGLRKVPHGFPASLSNEIGKPVSRIDDPFGCHKSFALHISSLLIEGFNKLGVTFTLRRANEEYEKGTFDNEIMEILSRAKEVGEIIKEAVGQTKYTEQLPFLPICAQCGRIYTTRAYAFDGNKIRYRCDLSFVGKDSTTGQAIEIKGCGYEGETDVRGGKLAWKVEFAARWRALRINYEAYGKDILDSVRCNDAICRRILGYEPPVHSFYEMFTERSGKKISKSAGNVFTPQMWMKYASPESLRLLFLKKLATTRVVDPDAIPSYMDEVDELAKVYFNEVRVKNEKELRHMKRLYEYVYFLGTPKARPAINVHYNMLAELLNIAKERESAKRILQRTGHVPLQLSAEEADELDRRLYYVGNWLVDTVREERVEKFELSSEQRASLEALIRELRNSEWSEEALNTRLFELAKECDLSQNQFFEGVYLTLLNNKRGPRLAQLIMGLGLKHVANTLEERLTELQ
jgi:lysyl-tRNA synthetase, class I